MCSINVFYMCSIYIFILQAVLIAPFFVWGFSSSQGIYYTSQTLEQIFNVRMKVIFGEKSLSSVFRILRQKLTTVFPAM